MSRPHAGTDQTGDPGPDSGPAIGARLFNGFPADESIRPGAPGWPGAHDEPAEPGEIFQSPSRGPVSFSEMLQAVIDHIKADPGSDYKLIIGTDSQERDEVTFVSAVIIHRLGKGARYFYRRQRLKKFYSMQQRILYEASLSLALASRLAEGLADNLTEGGQDGLNVEVHLDVGLAGETRTLIREVVGMITGSGFDAKIKPESFGASKVADRHTK